MASASLDLNPQLHPEQSKLSSQEILAEQAHYHKVLSAYKNYLQHSLANHRKRKRDFLTLPARHRQLVSPAWHEKWDVIATCIRVNAAFINQVISGQDDLMEFDGDEGPLPNTGHSHDCRHGHDHSNGHSHSHDHISDEASSPAPRHTHDNSHPPVPHAETPPPHHSHIHGATPNHNTSNSNSSVRQAQPTEADMDKVRSTIRQFVRDWSEEGCAERDAVYKPMTDALEKAFERVPTDQRGALSVLIPGAGLGRLAFDVAQKGFSCQGNEFSFFMLIASNFVLNRLHEPHQCTIYPWVHSLSNATTSSNQLHPVRIPDVLPGNIPKGCDFSMTAGDFIEIYSSAEHTGRWSAVLTCFFLDTAHNIIDYIEIIHNVLADGGVWINCGPLLYHFEGIPGEVSLELSLDEVMDIVQKVGFDVIEQRFIPSTYATNPSSMLKYQYNCSFFVAVKKPRIGEEPVERTTI
ncbi:carnosine N-methyltransferase [Synchytrium endobioticum]|uniref:carnosine N-methyltransferase n=1 Tax=Synchytrium endobioticum TaxID=286115 RepID=A0A507CWL6_9FUNG|nr:carnosine N-methyltransferase [Synchytrium endobioticum]TPX43599.1 carnosine N-methyltransferase [Synchytrium endobioticum]